MTLAARLATTAWRQSWQVHGDFDELVSWLSAAGLPDDPGLTARVLAVRAVVNGFRGRTEQAAADLADAIAAADGSGERWTVVSVLAARAELADDPRDGVRLYEEAMAAADSDAYTFVPVNLPSRLAIMYRRTGDRESSAELHRRVREVCDAAGDRFEQSSLDVQLATLALLEGRPDEATVLAGRALLLKRGLNDALGVAHGLEVLAGASSATGDQVRAATLLGSSSARWRSIGAMASSNQPFFPQRRQVAAEALLRLGSDRYAAAFTAGSWLDEDESIDLALGETAEPVALVRGRPVP